MKTMMIALGLFFVMGFANPASAQNISINVNINLDRQPSWGPTGYDYAEFYYMPDINVYYDVVNSLFYHYSRGAWISVQYLPSDYRKYDFYNMYKVVLNEKQPWLNNKTHKKSYARYKGDKTQEPIRYSTNSRYNDSKGNNRKWAEAPTDKKSNNNKNVQQNTNNNKNQNNAKPNNNSNSNNNNRQQSSNGGSNSSNRR